MELTSIQKLVEERPRGMGRVRQFYFAHSARHAARIYQHGARQGGEWMVSLRGGSLLQVRSDEIEFLRELADVMQQILNDPPIDFQI